MDLRTQRYFLTVAQELNFTRAAEKLQMSQPPLSNTIKELEEDLGVQLFIRGKRHLQLTDAGRLLMQRSAQMLELADKTRSELTAFGNELSGRLCLASVDGRAPFLAAKWIAGFHEEYPKVSFDLWNGSSDDIIDRLYRGLADLAVVAAPYDTEHLDGIEFGQEPWVAIMSRNHPLAKEPGTTVRLSEIAGESLIIPQRKSRIEAIEKWFHEIGEEVNVLCTMSNYLDAVAMAEQNVGVCIFPLTMPHSNPNVVYKTIVEPAKYLQYVLVHPKSTSLEGIPAAFVEYVQDLLETGSMDTVPAGEDPYSVPEGADIL